MKGHWIAQIVIQPYLHMQIKERKHLSGTETGAKGFGYRSTFGKIINISLPCLE